MKPVEIRAPRMSKGGMNPTNTSANRPPPPKGSGGSAHTKIKTMDLRKAAKRVSELWGQGYDAEHHVMVLAMSDLDDALAQPDLLDEAVELLRAVRRGCNCGYDYLCSACQAAINASRFVSRYDAAQQEQNDA